MALTREVLETIIANEHATPEERAKAQTALDALNPSPVSEPVAEPVAEAVSVPTAKRVFDPVNNPLDAMRYCADPDDYPDHAAAMADHLAAHKTKLAEVAAKSAAFRTRLHEVTDAAAAAYNGPDQLNRGNAAYLREIVISHTTPDNKCWILSNEDTAYIWTGVRPQPTVVDVPASVESEPESAPEPMTDAEYEGALAALAARRAQIEREEACLKQ